MFRAEFTFWETFSREIVVKSGTEMSKFNFGGFLGCCPPEFSPLFLSDAFVFEIAEMGTATAWAPAGFRYWG